MAKRATTTLQIGSNVRGFAGSRVRGFNALTHQPANPLTAGLTLIEILISIAILAFALTLILQSLGRGAYALALAGNRLRAYEFAAAKMGDLELAWRLAEEPKARGSFRMGGTLFTWSLDEQPLERPEMALSTLTIRWDQGRHEQASQVEAVHRVPPPEPE